MMNHKEAYNYLSSRLAAFIDTLEGTENLPIGLHLREMLDESEKICAAPPFLRPGRAPRRGSTMGNEGK